MIYAFRQLAAKLEERKNTIMTDIAHGVAEDYSRYQRLVGIVEGIELCISYMSEIEGEDSERG